MDRRKFVIGTVAGASSLTLPACGGGASGTGSASAAAASSSSSPSPSSPSSPSPVATSPVNDPAVLPDHPQFLTWDGGSGPSRDFWSSKLQLPWTNSGRGDWLDVKHVPQGATAYATATVSVGSIQLDVSSLVNRWLSSGLNRGFYLRSGESWAFNFAGRGDKVASARPKLLITSNGVTTTIDCTCNAVWSPSSFQPTDSRDTFPVAKDAWFAALQFDLSTVTGPIQSAVLSLTCLSLKYPGVLEVFELNPPAFRNGGGALPVRSGLASAYSFDHGINAHSSVLFAGDFSDISRKRWQAGGVAAGTSQIADARTGSTYLRGLIPQGDVYGCDLQQNIVNGTSAGIPAKTETELYGRYYVFLEQDWGSEVDANKMPGWDGRFGWWNSMGYWQNTTGNGGARPTGLKVKNAAANRWEYEGASMRGHGGTRSNDGNPYDDLFWVGSYMYHLDQEGPFGEPIKWTGFVIGKGRWYCIEQYIKMNSITGPFDEAGNGVATNDGEYRVWVDGVQCYERTNFRWRRHPEMGIQGFWLDWYHGGTSPAPRTMHFRMDSVVLARAYIGPRNERA